MAVVNVIQLKAQLTLNFGLIIGTVTVILEQFRSVYCAM